MRILDLLAMQTAVALTYSLHLREPPNIPNTAWAEVPFVIWVLGILVPLEFVTYVYLFGRVSDVLDKRITSE